MFNVLNLQVKVSVLVNVTKQIIRTMFYITSITLILSIVFKNISIYKMFLRERMSNTMADTYGIARKKNVLKNKQFTSHTIYFVEKPIYIR